MAKQSVLDTIKSKSKGTPLSVNDFGSDYAPTGLTPSQEKMYQQSQEANTPQTGRLHTEDYYPGINHNVGVGNYSGNIIGSTTLFAPGGALVPVGMMDARDKAVQQAAQAKAAEVDAFKAKHSQAPTSKLVNVNDKLTKDYYGFIDSSWQQAMRKSNNDPNKAKFILEQDPQFAAKEKAYQDKAKYSDAIFDKMSKDDEDIKTGKFVATPTYLKTRNELATSFDSSHPDFQNLGNNFRKLHVEREFGDALNDASKQLFLEQHAGTYTSTDDPDFVRDYETTSKQYTPEQKEYLKNTMNAIYEGSDYHTPEYIDRNVDAFTSAIQKTKKVSTHAKPSDKGDMENLDVRDISDENGSMLGNVVQSEPGKETKTREGNFTQMDGLTFKKPIKVVIPASADVTDMTTGKKRTDKAVRNAVIGGIYNAYTYKGQIVDDEFMKDPAKAKLVDVVPMASVIFTEQRKNKAGNMEDFETSGQVPMEQVKNALRGKRNQNDEVLDEYEKRAAEKTSQLKQTGTGQINETQSKGGTYTIKGKKYNLADLKGMGYNEADLLPYKDK